MPLNIDLFHALEKGFWLPQLRLPPATAHGSIAAVVDHDIDCLESGKRMAAGEIKDLSLSVSNAGIERIFKSGMTSARVRDHLPVGLSNDFCPPPAAATPLKFCDGALDCTVAIQSEGPLRIWNTQDKLSFEMPAPSSCVAMAVHPSGTYVALMFAQHGLLLMLLKDGVPTLMPRRRAVPRAMPKARIGIDPRSGHELGWNLTLSGAKKLRMAPNRHWLGVIDRDDKLRLVNTASLKFHFPISNTIFEEPLSDFIWSPKGQQVACATLAGRVKVLTNRALNEMASFEVNGPVFGLMWLPSTDQLLAVLPTEAKA